jgi:hypothetical protein
MIGLRRRSRVLEWPECTVAPLRGGGGALARCCVLPRADSTGKIANLMSTDCQKVQTLAHSHIMGRTGSVAEIPLRFDSFHLRFLS